VTSASWASSQLHNAELLKCCFTHKSGFIKFKLFTTDGQSASLFWCQAPIWSLWPDFCFLSDDCRCLDVGHPLWREDWSVIYCTIASGPCQSGHCWVEVPQNSSPQLHEALCFYLQRGTSERSSTSHRLFLPICLMYCYSLQIKMGFKNKNKNISLSHLRLPQLGGPGPRSYIPQEQGVKVILVSSQNTLLFMLELNINFHVYDLHG
jgi:hypothetical protein